MRWRQFAALLTSALTSANVTRVHLLGALLADIPHTRPIPVSTCSSTAELGEQLGLLPSTYEGPTGIVGVLADALGRIGVRVPVAVGGRAGVCRPSARARRRRTRCCPSWSG